MIKRIVALLLKALCSFIDAHSEEDADIPKVRVRLPTPKNIFDGVPKSERVSDYQWLQETLNGDGVRYRVGTML